MRSWVNRPEILDNPKDFTFVSLFKSNQWYMTTIMQT